MVIKPSSILLFGFLFSINIVSLAQDENSFQIEKCARLQGGGIIQHNNELNSFDPGIELKYCYGIKTSKNIGAGFGVGFQLFKDESFVPVVLDLVWFLKKNPKCTFVYIEGGYSLGWSEKYKDYINSTFSGGPVAGIGYGKQICVKDQYKFFINIGYQLQAAQLKYETHLEESKHKSILYNMLIVNFGMMLEQ